VNKLHAGLIAFDESQHDSNDYTHLEIESRQLFDLYARLLHSYLIINHQETLINVQ
jgi:hypothetical protein